MRFRRLQKITKIVLLGSLTIIIMIVVYEFAARKLAKKHSNSSETNIETPVELSVDIPNDYNIKKDGPFQSKFFNIYYIEATGIYSIQVYPQDDRSFDEMKDWITEQFPKFADLSIANSRNIEFTQIEIPQDSPDSFPSTVE